MRLVPGGIDLATGGKSIQPLKPMCKPMCQKKLQCSIDGGGLPRMPVLAQTLQYLVGTHGMMGLEQDLQNPRPEGRQPQLLPCAGSAHLTHCVMPTLAVIVAGKDVFPVGDDHHGFHIVTL